MTPPAKPVVNIYLKGGSKYYNIPLTQAEVNQLITNASADPTSGIIRVEVQS